MKVCSQDTSQNTDHYNNTSRCRSQNYLNPDDLEGVVGSENPCQFCEWKISGIRFLRENLHIRYFDVFNFYFAKPVNEILAQYSMPHVITFKDYQYYDYENEYLKRYYTINEVSPRLNVLINFFTNSYKPTRPNLIVTNAHQVIQKRNFRQTRLFLRLLQRNPGTSSAVHQEHLRFYTQKNEDDSSESEPSSLATPQESENAVQDIKQEGENEQNGNHRNNIPTRVLHSRLSSVTQLSSINQIPGQNIADVEQSMTWERRYFIQMSFSSSIYDIYCPSRNESDLKNEYKLDKEEEEEKKNIEEMNKSNKKKQTLENNSCFLDQFVIGSDNNSNNNMSSTNRLKKFTDSVMALQEKQYSELLDLQQEYQNSLQQIQQNNQGKVQNQSSDREVKSKLNKHGIPDDFDDFDPCQYILGSTNSISQNGNFGLLFEGSNKGKDKQLIISAGTLFTQSEGQSDQKTDIIINNNHQQFIVSDYEQIIKSKSNHETSKKLISKQKTGLDSEQEGKQVFTDPFQMATVSSEEQEGNKQKQLTTQSSPSSIQQIQKYILSQIKKKHDHSANAANSNNNNSNDPKNTISNLLISHTHMHNTSRSPASKSKEQTEQQISKDTYLVQKPKLKEQTNHNQLHRTNSAIKSTSRKLLTERNLTEINLGSVFEQLRQTNRLASLEAKRNITNNNENNTSNSSNSCNPTGTERILHPKKQENTQQQPNQNRNHSSKKRTTQHVSPRLPTNPRCSVNTSPQGFTPRDLKKQPGTISTTGYILNLGDIRSNSKHIINSEQSPLPTSARGPRKNSSSTATTNNQNQRIGWKQINDGALSAREHLTYKTQNNNEGQEGHNAITRIIPLSQSSQVTKTGQQSNKKPFEMYQESIRQNKQQIQGNIIQVNNNSRRRSPNKTAVNSKSTLNSPSRVYTDHNSNFQTLITERSGNQQQSDLKYLTKNTTTTNNHDCYYQQQQSRRQPEMLPSQQLQSQQNKQQQQQQYLEFLQESQHTNLGNSNSNQLQSQQQYQLGVEKQHTQQIQQQQQQQEHIASYPQRQILQDHQQLHQSQEQNDKIPRKTALSHRQGSPSSQPQQQLDQLAISEVDILSSNRIRKQIAQKIISKAITNTIDKSKRNTNPNEDTYKDRLFQKQLEEEKEYKYQSNLGQSQESQLKQQVYQEQQEFLNGPPAEWQNIITTDEDNDDEDQNRGNLFENNNNNNQRKQMIITGNTTQQRQDQGIVSAQVLQQHRSSSGKNIKLKTSITPSASNIQSKKKQLLMRQKASKPINHNEVNSLTGIATNQSMNASLNNPINNNYTTINNNNNYQSANGNSLMNQGINNSQLQQSQKNLSNGTMKTQKLRETNSSQNSGQNKLLSTLEHKDRQTIMSVSNFNRLFANKQSANGINQQHNSSVGFQRMSEPLIRTHGVINPRVKTEANYQYIHNVLQTEDSQLMLQSQQQYKGQPQMNTQESKINYKNLLTQGSNNNNHQMAENSQSSLGNINYEGRVNSNQQWQQSESKRFNEVFPINNDSKMQQEWLETQGKSKKQQRDIVLEAVTGGVAGQQQKQQNQTLEIKNLENAKTNGFYSINNNNININNHNSKAITMGAKRKQDDILAVSQLSLQQTLKSRMEEIQQGQGFYTQRNLKNDSGQSNEYLQKVKEYQQQAVKCIQSSRGSYQGNYQDLTAWKHAGTNKLIQHGSPSPPRQQEQQQQLYQQFMKARDSQFVLQGNQQQIPVNSVSCVAQNNIGNIVQSQSMSTIKQRIGTGIIINSKINKQSNGKNSN